MRVKIIRVGVMVAAVVVCVCIIDDNGLFLAEVVRLAVVVAHTMVLHIATIHGAIGGLAPKLTESPHVWVALQEFALDLYDDLVADFFVEEAVDA